MTSFTSQAQPRPTMTSLRSQAQPRPTMTSRRSQAQGRGRRASAWWPAEEDEARQAAVRGRGLCGMGQAYPAAVSGRAAADASTRAGWRQGLQQQEGILRPSPPCRMSQRHPPRGCPCSCPVPGRRKACRKRAAALARTTSPPRPQVVPCTGQHHACAAATPQHVQRRCSAQTGRRSQALPSWASEGARDACAPRRAEKSGASTRTAENGI